ncbi:MAG: NAD-dependent epimerase/dehydratase family protein [Ferruginibacter sp.]|nr:NAD-dependent epimerase/dehydratase family protein [Ferruginibacter sp.]
MKIIITGSLGNISKPLTQLLVQANHTVTVISSSPERQTEIESLGATAAIGTMQDIAFLTKTFTGADMFIVWRHLVTVFSLTKQLTNGCNN